MATIPSSQLSLLRILVLGSTMCWVLSCAGPVLRGRLVYEKDPSIPTKGDSVWVRPWNCDSCGATILKVKADHSWKYKAKPGKDRRPWSLSAGMPPLGADTLQFEAITDSFKTKTAIVTYLTHKSKDSVIVLQYEPRREPLPPPPPPNGGPPPPPGG